MMLVLMANDQPLSWATRGFTVAAALLAAALLMDMVNGPRDRLLLPLCGLLSTLSVVFLSRIDMLLATKQLMWIVIGSALMVAMYLLVEDIRSLGRVKYTAGALAIALLIVTVLWGEERYGARLWLGIPNLITFQSGEVAKILMAVFLAGYVADRGEVIRRTGRRRWGLAWPPLRAVAPLLIVVFFCLALFVGQRDLGAAMLFFGLFVVMIYLATGQASYGLIGVVLFGLGTIAAYYLFPHVASRLISWLNPWQDPTGAGYQSLQALFCLSEGGVSGVGLGQIAVHNLPAAPTDLILVVIGQDVGLIGALGVVMLYALVSWRSFNIAWQAEDRFGSLLAAALATVFALQSLIIMAGVLRLMPLTGITTPFLSYGGTSVIVNFLALGLLLAVSRDCLPVPESA